MKLALVLGPRRLSEIELICGCTKSLYHTHIMIWIHYLCNKFIAQHVNKILVNYMQSYLVNFDILNYCQEYLGLLDSKQFVHYNSDLQT